MDTNLTLQTADIENRIHIIRNQQVMIDRDLAELYGVETKRLNEQVKRNSERFPLDFCFQLNELEYENWKSQFATSNSDKMGLRRAPYAFTEQGVGMLASVLKSETAIKASVKIMRAFVAMRRFIQNNAQIFVELSTIKKHLMETDIHQLESDKKIEHLLSIMDRYQLEDKQGVFFQGKIFDAYVKFESFIQSAKREIILIDQYVDLSVLERLAKKQNGVNVKIYTNPRTSLTPQDISVFNIQYPTLTLQYSTTIHDRFLIIDRTTLYHIGASLKDLGKKCFAFEIMEDAPKLIPMIIANA